MAAKGGKAKERYEAAKERARTLAKAMGRGLKSSAMDGGVGFAAYYVAKAAADNVETLRKPYYLPAALFATGHVVGRKPKLHNAGVALKAVAGFLAAQQWQADRDAKAKQQTNLGTELNKVAQQGPGVQGIDDYSPGWSQLLPDASGMSAPELPQAITPPMSAASIGGAEAAGLVGGSAADAMGLMD